MANGLLKKIASVALSFFEKASDLLPSEPFIYASRQGDLVCRIHSKIWLANSDRFAKIRASLRSRQWSS